MSRRRRASSPRSAAPPAAAAPRPPRRARKRRRPGSGRGERADGVGGWRSPRVVAGITAGNAASAASATRERCLLQRTDAGRRESARWAQGARGERERAKGLQRACSPCAVAEGQNRAATSYRRRRWRAAARCPAGARLEAHCPHARAHHREGANRAHGSWWSWMVDAGRTSGT